MPEYGSFSKNQLAEKLVDIPETEMKAYHEKRMRGYKLQYIPTIFLGVAGILVWFAKLEWLSAALGIIGVVFFSYVVFKRQSWLRLYHHLIYVRAQRLKRLEEMNEQKKPAKKFDKLEKKKGD
jgi:hypothetical protein